MYVMEEKFCFKMKGGFVPFAICPLCLMSIYTEKSKLPSRSVNKGRCSYLSKVLGKVAHRIGQSCSSYWAKLLIVLSKVAHRIEQSAIVVRDDFSFTL